MSTDSTRALIVLYAILGSFSPVWDQPPPQRIKATLLSLWVEPDRENVLARSDIPTDGQISLWRDRDVVTPG